MHILLALILFIIASIAAAAAGDTSGLVMIGHGIIYILTIVIVFTYLYIFGVPGLMVAGVILLIIGLIGSL